MKIKHKWLKRLIMLGSVFGVVACSGGTAVTTPIYKHVSAEENPEIIDRNNLITNERITSPTNYMFYKFENSTSLYVSKTNSSTTYFLDFYVDLTDILDDPQQLFIMYMDFIDTQLVINASLEYEIYNSENDYWSLQPIFTYSFANDVRDLDTDIDASVNDGGRQIYSILSFASGSPYYGSEMRLRIGLSLDTAMTRPITHYYLGNILFCPFNRYASGVFYTSNEINTQYNNGYNSGYEVGYNSGVRVGQENVVQEQYSGYTYQQIFNMGYNSGYNASIDSDSLLPQLFSGIIDIPIEALNGLMPLTFFDVSVIRVVITILAFSVVLYIIGYLMSKGS